MKSKIYSRKVAKDAKFGNMFFTFAPSRPFGFAQRMLCGKYSESFGCGSARLFVVNQNALLCTLCVSAVTSLKKKGE
jgi:hypothetical protein